MSTSWKCKEWKKIEVHFKKITARKEEKNRIKKIKNFMKNNLDSILYALS